MRSAAGLLLGFLLCAAEAAPQDLGPAEAKDAFLKLLDRPKVAPEVRTVEVTVGRSGRVAERLTFVSEKRADGSVERVPLLLMRPGKTDKKVPAVLVLHGFTSHKENMRWWLERLVERGMVGAAIDARHHGERAAGGDSRRAYDEAILQAWRAKPGEPREHPWYYDTCWDIWRTLDYLETREEVDPTRLAVIGFSMGGAETWLSASVDERVKVAVVGLSAQSFRWSLEHDGWRERSTALPRAHHAAAMDLGTGDVTQEVCRELWGKVTPGLCGPYDFPSLIRLFAGRPLLLLNGDNDPTCPIEGAKVAFGAAREAYKAAGAEDRLRIDIARKDGHQATSEEREKTLEWLGRWLKRE